MLRATTYGALIGAVRGDVHEATRNPGLLNVLARREAEILGFVAQALANRQIGRRLAITENTVKRHLPKAFKKLDVGSRLQAVNRLHGGTARTVAGKDGGGRERGRPTGPAYRAVVTNSWKAGSLSAAPPDLCTAAPSAPWARA